MLEAGSRKECQRLFAQMQISHPGSAVSSHVTLSIEVASSMPSDLRSPSS
ncbi:hypothetical protein ACE1CB_11515 [Aerosakkonema sp. BLCC-F2]